MRVQSSAQGESGAKARARLPSVLPPAAAAGHLSLLAISVVCTPRAHSLGSPLVVSVSVSFDSRVRVSDLVLLLCEFQSCLQSS